ncbi:MAG: hypothetical protein ABIO05_04780, partial [Ferruginibacter sp.]
LNQVETLLNNAKDQPQRALWLFENNLRTPLFMLEALAKMYRKIHDKNIFKKLQDQFKKLEDILGDIDHYNATGKSYAVLPGARQEILIYYQNKKIKYLQKLEKTLIEEGWSGNAERVPKIKAKLQKASWLTEDLDVAAIKDFYKNAIEDIKGFWLTTKPFKDLENEVHEMRRKIRWLSIYPQALRGSIQLAPNEPAPDYFKKYLVDEIVNSPYNKMPNAQGCNTLLMLDKNSFLAMSWLISNLGTLKDEGLNLLTMQEAEENTGIMPAQENNNKEGTLQNLLLQATKICQTFFDEKVLETLVLKVVTNEKIMTTSLVSLDT